MSTSQHRLRDQLRQFAADRDWGQFHTPKNLAMALAGETGELVAELQWLSDDEIAQRLNEADFRQRVEDEVADVLMYIIRFADMCEIDLDAAVQTKIAKNDRKYPVDLARGSSEKYTRLGK